MVWVECDHFGCSEPGIKYLEIHIDGQGLLYYYLCPVHYQEAMMMMSMIVSLRLPDCKVFNVMPELN